MTLAGILANTTITPNIPDILADLGQDSSQAGVLVASGPLPGIFVAPILGVAADRFGRQRVLLPCLVLFGLSGIGAAVAPTFAWLLFARFVQGLGSAGLINLAIVLIGDHWTGIERTKLIGRNSAVLTLGLAILPSISGLIAEVASWRWAVAISSVGLAVAAAGVVALPDTRPEQIGDLGEQLRGARQVLRRPIVLAVVLSGFLLFVVIFGVFLTTLPIHLEEQFGLGPGVRGVVLSTPAIGSTLVAFNLGGVRSRYDIRTVLVGGGGCVALASLGVGLAPLVALVVLSSIIYGVGDGAIIATLQDVATSAAPASQRASVMAAWVSGVRAGQAVGPLVFAALFAATSTSIAMVVGAVLFAVVAGFFWVGPINEAAIEAAAKVDA